MNEGSLEVVEVAGLAIWRVGFAPDAFAWPAWEYSPFAGRFDDPEEEYRVVYVGTSAVACLVEVLSRFRVDPELAAQIDAINPSEIDVHFPTVAVGVVPREFFSARRLGSGELWGTYVDLLHARTIANLWRQFVGAAKDLGLADFDGAALRARDARELTRAVSRHLFLQNDQPVDGIRFESRHGAGLDLYAVFENAGGIGSPALRHPVTLALDAASSDVREVLDLLGLELG